MGWALAIPQKTSNFIACFKKLILMRISVIIFVFSALFLLAGCGGNVPEEVATAYNDLPDKIDFNFHVRPILSDRCYACHGPDENTREAEMRLDIEEGAFAKQKNADGFVLVAGKPDESGIMHRILSDDSDFMMPPPESEMHLTEKEKGIIYKWIEQGAEWKDHWAFIPPGEIDVPRIRQSDPTENEIDHFIIKKLEEKGMKPAPAASKEEWIRRVSFDLTGLPPQPQAIEAFLQDDSENAFEKVVDELLASPAYGERMATVWLDVARYADSHGYQDDRPRTMWPWRDWVIKAFNDNLPYDDFVTWQIAGDLLPDATYEQKLATGFNRNHAITQEGGVVQEEYLNEYAADRTQTFATAFLGLTMECSRCHSHKFDPISQEDYYSLLGFFNNISERGQISYFDLAPTPNMPMEDPLMDSQIVQVKDWITKKVQELDALKNTGSAGFDDWYNEEFSLEKIKADLKEGLLADFDLNDLENGQFDPSQIGRPKGLMNVNLPPSIELPEYVNGKDGKALKFNGANFLSLGEIGDFEWYDAFSFGGWVKHTGVHKKNAGIFARRVGEQKRQGYDLVLTPTNQLAARLIHNYFPKRNNRPGVNFAIDVQTRSRIPINQWRHVFVTYDGSGKADGLHIFINGQLQAVQVKMDSLRGKTILNGNDFLAGNWNHRARELGDLYGFKGGLVDNVQLFNRELSPVEVQLIAGNNKQPGKTALYAHFLNKIHPEYRHILLQLDSLRRIDLEKPMIMVMEEVDTVKETFILDRGAYDAPTQKVSRATPKAVLALSESYPKNRLGLAQWLFDENNPLTGRVIVNRFWQMFFGKGIVATPEDFGNQGALPTHPELLDWLASYYRKQGWDTKQLVKLMVLSSTYRQDASITPIALQLDKENTWLGRGPSKRLTAEMLRDQALVASGLYYEKVGGKWVKPYQPTGIWKELANQIGENKYRPGSGQDLYRRSLYGYWKRTIPPPNMLTFDASERAVCTVKRQQTSTPLQSLILLNDPMFIEASRKLAEHIMTEELPIGDQIDLAFTKVVSRSPQLNEAEVLNEIYESERQRFDQHPEQAQQLLETGASGYHQQLNKSELAALTVVVNAIFNLDEAKYQ